MDLPLRQQNVEGCIDECTQCAAECMQAAIAPFTGPRLKPAHRRLLIACAEICRSTARLLLGSATDHVATCGACADLCTRCAELCEHDGILEECAQRCRSCAQTCLTLARAAGAGRAAANA